MNKGKYPCRGDVWLARFEPKVGQEIGKVRPAVVANENDFARLNLRIIVPVTDWKPVYENYPWFIHLTPSDRNGLKKESGADSFQVKSVSVERLIRKIGAVKPREMEEISAGIAMCVGYVKSRAE